MPDHFLRLKGARTINTRYFAETQEAVRDVCDALAMGAVHGDAGLGKTFAVSHACERASLPAFKLEFLGRSTMKQITRELLRTVTGIPHEGERFGLTDELIEVLGMEERLIVVDEAQRLNHECIEHLRHLHDDKRTSFALLLVGGNGCWEVLSRYPMLRSRIYRPVPFGSLSGDEVIEVLSGFHPIYSGADPEAIWLVDDVFARGNFRNWASFTKTVADATSLDTPLTMEAARTALARLSGVTSG